MEIFRQRVVEDKEALGIIKPSGQSSATYITVHRGKLLDDGYSQLSLLRIRDMKGIIRVKFVNEQVQYLTNLAIVCHILC